MMRKRSPIRLNNLERLIHEAGSASKLASAAGTNSSYLSQVRNQLPTRNGTPRSIGDALAVKLESAMNKPAGWMDEVHQDAPHPTEGEPKREASRGQKLYPLLSWNQVGKQSGVSEDPLVPYENRHLACPVPCSPETFVLRVRSASMEPKFRQGELLFVDPRRSAGHGDYVIVRLLTSAESTFRQLIIEEGRRYLKATNPDWPEPITLMDHQTIICGVIVFKGEILLG